MPKTNVIFTKRNEGGLFDEVGNTVEISDGTYTLAVNPDGSINVVSGGGAATQDVDIVAQTLESLTVNLATADLAALSPTLSNNQMFNTMKTLLEQAKLTNAYLAIMAGEQLTLLEIDDIYGGV